MNISKHVKNIIGERFGKLVVKKLDSTRGVGSKKAKRSFWLCVCDCGKERIVSRDGLKGNRKIRSCGCNRLGNAPNNKCYKDISGTYFSTIIARARKRNIVFDITIEELSSVWEEQNGKCALSGLPIEHAKYLGIRNCGQKYGFLPGTASLDRINSKMGYVKGNVQWVHKDINRMKLNHSEEYFIELCDLVSKNKGCTHHPERA